MMNAPSHRLRRPERRPAATAQADHHDDPDGDAARRTADHAAAGETARDLVYLCTGAAATEPPQDGQSAAVLKPHADTPLPAVILKWDEAERHAGGLPLQPDRPALFGRRARLLRRGCATRQSGERRRPGGVPPGDARHRRRNNGPRDQLVPRRGTGRQRDAFPKQEFREGFNLAGDDAVSASSASTCWSRSARPADGGPRRPDRLPAESSVRRRPR